MEIEKRKINLNFENEKKRTFTYCMEVANFNEFKDIFNNFVFKRISKEVNILDDENHESILNYFEFFKFFHVVNFEAIREADFSKLSQLKIIINDIDDYITIKDQNYMQQLQKYEEEK